MNKNGQESAGMGQKRPEAAERGWMRLEGVVSGQKGHDIKSRRISRQSNYLLG